MEKVKALEGYVERLSKYQELVALAADFLVSQSALSSPQIGSLSFSCGASFAI